MRHGDVVKWRLAGLRFADYLVLTPDNLSDMKVLLTTCEAEAAQLRLISMPVSQPLCTVPERARVLNFLPSRITHFLLVRDTDGLFNELF